jgi:alpha-beta hydrolase superfamily lysophospholipase
LQEQILFRSHQIPSNYTFQFNNEFEEIYLKTDDKTVKLHGLHFKSIEQKGIVLFFHGNGGTVNEWGQNADFYTNLGYDIFYLDYRTYGKSGGKIENEKQLINDAQLAYDFVKTKFNEDKIILSGTSMGTGMAAQIAAANQPKLLLLNSPYSSLEKRVREIVFFLPKFLIKYKFKTIDYLDQVNCPIYVFHGDHDLTIPHSHALTLKAKHDKINLTILEDFGHNVASSEEYKLQMNSILEK